MKQSPLGAQEVLQLSGIRRGIRALKKEEDFHRPRRGDRWGKVGQVGRAGYSARSRPEEPLRRTTEAGKCRKYHGSHESSVYHSWGLGCWGWVGGGRVMRKKIKGTVDLVGLNPVSIPQLCDLGQVTKQSLGFLIYTSACLPLWEGDG